MIKIFGVALILFSFLPMGLSIISTSETPTLTHLGIVLFAIGIGMLVLSKILVVSAKWSCNCCKCGNCKLEHDHWSH